MLLVDLDASGLQTITPLPVPRFQALASVKGNLAALAEAMKNNTALPLDPQLDKDFYGIRAKAAARP